ncbi:hypothetical protein EMIHUDRAFT_228496 [Emiliania huxleyi CCMP1516]|uniref:Tubulin-specific chaperone A n=2 Tax=Emiliania huxleyi TaxID=2903 RepID=A0A0D3KFJ7_EMIH1|nr:hypothetical protein EMIHUDRAFT_228496 [Emiliania huxleyi CCMP1516]EOD34532.1 hypothetical protein EMIHUDRAFT_228496 [Emiliania huxleyi CCMP1516]|eukprot:XP_005786961.1 hypothetical protein EMIHUDRAFT_228496 [Emiliania huxleyi CCMP1516]
MMRGQRGRRSAPTLLELRRDRDRQRAVLASIRAADDGLETALESDEILACFEEALGEQLPDMGTDAAAGREANAERAEAAPRLEAAAEKTHSQICLAVSELA